MENLTQPHYLITALGALRKAVNFRAHTCRFDALLEQLATVHLVFVTILYLAFVALMDKKLPFQGVVILRWAALPFACMVA